MNDLLDELNEELKKLSAPYRLEETSVAKNNGEVKGIMIKNDILNVSPIIYPDEAFMDLRLSEKIAYLTDILESCTDKGMNMQEWFSRDYILSHVYPRIQGINNEPMIKDAGYIYNTWLDFIITYHVSVDIDDKECSSFAVRNNYLPMYDIDKHLLHRKAIKNLSEVIDILSFNEMFNCFDSPIDMYIVTNKDRYYGAAAIMSNEFLYNFSCDISDEFLILPSSVHEVIVVPVFWLVTDLNQYKKMVADINSTEVSPQDKLTDSVYYYKDGVVTCY